MTAGSLIKSAAFPIALILVWWFLVPVASIPDRYLPGLESIVSNAVTAAPELVAAVGRTGLEALLGFALAAISGVIWGTLFAKVGFLERAVLPLFVALQTIPVVAFGAIVVIWFGNTLLAKVFISFFLAFFPISVNTLQGLKGANKQRVDLFRSFGASSFKTYRSVELPAALPNIAVGLKTGVSLALVGAIVGEWFGDTVGLGVMLLQALYFEDVLRTWVLIVTTGLVGGAFYGLIALCEKRFIWWRSE